MDWDTIAFSLWPISLTLVWVIGIGWSQVWMGQRGYHALPRLMWGVIIILLNFIGVIAFLVLEVYRQKYVP